MKTFPLVIMLALAAFFVGCAGATDLSQHERFRSRLGRSAELTRPMQLVQHGGYMLGPADGIMSSRSARYGLAAPGTYRDPRVSATLPAGHRVNLDRAQEEVFFDAYQTVVYGRTTFPTTGKKVTFAYVHPPMMYSSALPMPWEE
jgi:hypothetical protein